MIAAGALLSSCSYSPKAQLQQKLEGAVACKQYWFGHQDDLMYGHSWSAAAEIDFSLTRSDVYSVTGSYPGVLGIDLGGIEKDKEANLDGNPFSLVRAAIVKHHERGGLVTLSWHLDNPLTGGNAWDNSSDAAVASILPDGEGHEAFLVWMDRVAEFISSCRDSRGRQIPVIFRPWHELNGGWFWWGSKTCTPEQYNALWVMTWKYMVQEKGLQDMIWAISPNAGEELFDSWTERYPGDEYVDLLGLDTYEHRGADQSAKQADEQFVTVTGKCLESLSEMAREHGKYLAVTEFGYESVPEQNWWTEVMQKAVDGYPIAYALAWRNASGLPGPHHYFAPWPGQISEADFVEYSNNGKVQFLHPNDIR